MSRAAQRTVPLNIVQLLPYLYAVYTNGIPTSEQNAPNWYDRRTIVYLYADVGAFFTQGGGKYITNWIHCPSNLINGEYLSMLANRPSFTSGESSTNPRLICEVKRYKVPATPSLTSDDEQTARCTWFLRSNIVSDKPGNLEHYFVLLPE